MRRIVAAVVGFLVALAWANGPAAAQPKPNIVFIMGDDIGWFNIGAYHQGMMAGRTPNLDRLAAEGMRFTDYYAEASCTAGRANFITGQLPIRTGLTTVGQAGSPIGMPDGGADHRHGAQVDGLRHRPVRQEPPGRPEPVPAHGARLRRVLRLPLPPRRDGGPVPSQLSAGAEGHGRPAEHGPSLGHRTRTTRPSAALGQGRQAEDRGRRRRSTRSAWRPSTTRSSTTTFKFIDKAKQDDKPFFVWLNPTRMHVVTHLSDKYEKMRTPENGWSIHEAGMAQLDDIVGSVMKKLKDMGVDGRHDPRLHAPTTARRTSPGPTAARRRSPAARARCSRAASACPASSAGRARCRPARSRTASSRASTGSRRSWPRPATRTSSTS